jgi:hypothetical protein
MRANSTRREKVKKALAVLSFALAGLIVSWILIHPLTLKAGLIGLAAGFLLGIIAASFLFARSRGEDPKKLAKELVNQAMHPDPGAEERPVHEQTARINLALRLDPHVSGETIKAFESLIDLLRDVAPKALESAPNSEMTYDIMELGKSHLPSLANRFLALSVESRQQAQDKLLNQLQELSDIVKTAGRALDEGRLSDFEAHQDFLKAKFGS